MGFDEYENVYIFKAKHGNEACNYRCLDACIN